MLMKSAIPFLSVLLGSSIALSLTVSDALAQGTTSPAAAPTAAAASSPTALKSANPVFARSQSGVVVTADDVASDMTRMPEETRRIMVTKPDTLQQIASNLMVRRALAKEAEVGNLAQTPSVAAALAIARDRVLSDARLAQIDAQNTPTDATIEAYAKQLYTANSDKFERPAQTRARHILLANTGPESMQKANALLEQLRAGVSFEAAAKSNSIDPGSAARGGDLGFFASGQMVRPFEEAVAKLAKAGDLSEPVESQFGLHIIRLEERREKGRSSFEEVRPQLLTEARTAIMNDGRTQKVLSLSKDFSFDAAAIEAFAKSAGR
jgi:peptidyl-prolyl cis-trans isomerase C